MKENYKERQLITYAWVALLAVMIGGRLAFGLIHFGVWNEDLIDWLLVWQKPGDNLLAGYGALLLATLGLSKIYNWKVWAFLEDNSINIALLFMFFLVDEFLRSGFDRQPLIYLVAVLDAVTIGWWFKSKYRSFTWYKSGKKGFVFWWGNLILWLVMAGFSFLLKDKLYMSITYLTLSLISVIGLVILGEVFELSVKKVKK
jgi:hypothetical protein